MVQPSLESCRVDPWDGFQYLSSYQNVSRWKNRNRFSLPISLWATFKRSLRNCFAKKTIFSFFLLIHEIIFTHVHWLIKYTDEDGTISEKTLPCTMVHGGVLWYRVTPNYARFLIDNKKNSIKIFFKVLHITNHDKFCKMCCGICFFISDNTGSIWAI